MSSNGNGNVTALHGGRGGEADDDARIDAILVDVRALTKRLDDESIAFIHYAAKESERGHAHANALLVLTADVATLTGEVATLTERINAQADLDAQRHRMVIDAINAMNSALATTRAKAHEARAVAEEARASRPDDGRLDALAADVIAAQVERQRSETQIATVRAHDSIRAREHRRALVAKAIGAVIGGSSLTYALIDVFTKLFGG